MMMMMVAVGYLIQKVQFVVLWFLDLVVVELKSAVKICLLLLNFP